MMNHILSCFLSVILGMLLFAGCGRSDYQTASVSGRVTLDGKPLGDASVSFQPVGKGNPNPGPGSYGVTDADGRFQLQLVGRKNGAVVGLHTVRIFRYLPRTGDQDDDSPRPRDPSVPKEADDGSLRFEVPCEGTDAADFVLTTKRSKKPN